MRTLLARSAADSRSTPHSNYSVHGEERDYSMTPNVEFVAGEHDRHVDHPLHDELDVLIEPEDTQGPATDHIDDERTNQLRDDPPDEIH